MGRILAIDYGSKRVGIAVTDPLKIIATPLTTITEPELIPFLVQYRSSELLERIVVGMPLRSDGSDTHATPLIRAFIKKLNQKMPDLPIETIDEAYTSKRASQAMVEGGMKKKDRRKKENIDQVSAVLILQSFLEHSS